MKKYQVWGAVILALSAGWYFYPSEYDSLMNEALKKQEENPTQKVFDGVLEPVMPDKKENAKTILGIDENQNGIRDDVDIWINRTGRDYNERMGMRQTAKAEQEMLKVCEGQLGDRVSEVSSATLKAWGCLHAVSDIYYKENYMQKFLMELTYNSALRNSCSKYLNTQVYSYTGADGHFHKNCEFKLENEDKVIEMYYKFWKFTKRQ